MIQNQELALYLHDFLACDHYKDYAPNGLQIEGKDSITRVGTAVTASMDVIKQAIAWKADALLVHHGYFWRGEEPNIRGMKKQRIEQLLAHGINLFAYHLPLDCHMNLGNNACIANRLQVDAINTHKAQDTKHLLWSGALSKAMYHKELNGLLQKTFQTQPISIIAHEKRVQHIAWCSGAAQDLIVEAKALGVDAYLSGEVSERTYYQALELGINYYACGHHATERFGIQSLGKHVSEVFGLEHLFFDSKNPF